MQKFDLAIVGGGIVGLATARRYAERRPAARILVLEKEEAVARHQTGHNSGVLHTGVYYKPGSLKARTCREGKRLMEAFCAEHGVPHELCGKVIVATREEELERLERLFERAGQNGVECHRMGPAELREREPHAAGLAALHLPGAGIVDFVRVCEAMARDLEAGGGRIETGVRVTGLVERGGEVVLETTRGEFAADRVANCAGLHSDRVARAAGLELDARVVPFRGEYYELVPAAHQLCRHLIYPVPDPAFPFLGVHFTRCVGGEVECGPNAVLAFKREGYRKLDISPRDLFDSLSWPGFLRLAARHWRMGLGEWWRSLNKAAFVRALQRLVPEIRAEHLQPAPAGVRAQAVARAGALVDDFLLREQGRVLHVLNAPSPAATASLAIGGAVAERLEAMAG